jgi:hypothetical protein
MNTDNLRKHGVKIVAIFSIVLLIVAANLDSPSLWLVYPAWLLLAGCIAIRFISVPNDSPYKQAFYLMFFPLIFFLVLVEKPFIDLFASAVEVPSGDNLMHFATSRPFLVLILIYFALACLCYGMSRQKHQELHEKVVVKY